MHSRLNRRFFYRSWRSWRGCPLGRGLCLIVLVSLLAGCARLGTAPDDYTGTVLDPPKELKDFTLTSHTGAPVSLSDLRGRPVLLFFGYTHCPDVCPTTLGEWKKIKAGLGNAARDVAFVFVGVDSKRDTPEALAQFLGKFDPDFTGLTGDEATIHAVAKDFGLDLHSHAGEGNHVDYLVDQSSPTFLLHRDGDLRVVFSPGTGPDIVSAQIRKLLGQS